MFDCEKKTHIKTQIKEALAKSTSHGIQKIGNSDNWTVRIFWILFSIISTSLCAFLIVQNILTYFKYDVTTKIRVKYDPNPEFPTVTVCNLNFFTTKYAYDFAIRELNESNDSVLALLLLQAFKNNLTEMKKFGDSLDKLIIYSAFELNFVNKSEDFTYFFHPFYGNCFMFNAPWYDNGTRRKNPLRSTKPGRLNCLMLQLNVSVYNLIENTNRGGVVFVHEFGTSPLSIEPITTTSRENTNIAIVKTRSTQLSKPYSDCDEGTDDPTKYDSEYYRSVHRTSFKYNQKLCFDLCFHRLILKNCSCYFSFLSYWPEGEPCLNETQINCGDNFYYEFIKSNNFVNLCLPKCPLECTTVSYTKMTSIYSNNKWERIDSNISGVNIYYEESGSTEIEESAVMDWVVLLSNIGGIAGIFLGASLLTFFEFFALLIEIFQILFSRKFQVFIIQNKKNDY